MKLIILILIFCFNLKAYEPFPETWENYNNEDYMKDYYVENYSCLENKNNKSIIFNIENTNIFNCETISIPIKIADFIIDNIVEFPKLDYNFLIKDSNTHKIKFIPNNYNDNFSIPLKNNYIITSKFGPRQYQVVEEGVVSNWHYGIDFGCPIGTPIYASKCGEVEFSGYKKGYGKVIIIKHFNGMKTVYAHCNTLLKTKGNNVSEGSQIARSGNTGRSTGPHLHFEIRNKNNEPQNPELFLNLFDGD